MSGFDRLETVQFDALPTVVECLEDVLIRYSDSVRMLRPPWQSYEGES